MSDKTGRRSLLAVKSPDPNPASTASANGRVKKNWTITAGLGVVFVASIAVIVLYLTAPHHCIGAWNPLRGNLGIDDQGRKAKPPMEIDPCDKQIISEKFSQYSKRLTYICYGVGTQKDNYREIRNEQSCHHYLLQIVTLICSAVATIFVAMKDTHEALARWAIITDGAGDLSDRSCRPLWISKPLFWSSRDG